MVEFLLNGLVFIMIGLQLRGILDRLSGESFSRLLSHGAILSATVIAVRILWVFPANYLPAFRRSRRGPPLSWRHTMLIGWTGMRGVVSLAVALALPLSLDDGSAFPGRDYILFITFFVIMVTLVLQGLSLPVAIRALGIKDDGVVEMEERTARIQANEAALARVLELRADPAMPVELLDRIEAEYFDRLRELEACGHCESQPGIPHAASLYERIEQETLTVERQTIIRLRDEYIIGDEVLRRIQRDLDLAEARLREKHAE
jgi:CPA1 family monovalent cation:H+ antiporter